MTREFTGPEQHHDADERDWEKSQNQNRPDWDKMYWKPVSGDENLIRILPGIGGVRYHFKGGKHFIKHSDGKTEMFICNEVTYQKPCPACEEETRLIKNGEDDAAKGFAAQSKGVFNVIDRTNLERGVLIWECPPVAVWERIIGIVKGKSKFHDLVGTDENPLMGRDVVVVYNPKASPQFKYDLQFDAVSQLGKKKQVEAWMAEARPLIPEEIYPEVDYAVAKIKTFGTKEEREELRKKLAAKYESKAKKEKEKAEVEKDIEGEKKKKEAMEKIAELEKQIEDMKSGETGKPEAKEEKEKPVEKEEEKEEVQKAEDALEEDEDDKKEAVEDTPSMSELRKQLADMEEAAAKKNAKEEEKPEAKEDVKEEKKEEAKEKVAEETKEEKKEETPEELALKIAKIRAKHE